MPTLSISSKIETLPGVSTFMKCLSHGGLRKVQLILQIYFDNVGILDNLG